MYVYIYIYIYIYISNWKIGYIFRCSKCEFNADLY